MLSGVVECLPTVFDSLGSISSTGVGSEEWLCFPRRVTPRIMTSLHTSRCYRRAKLAPEHPMLEAATNKLILSPVSLSLPSPPLLGAAGQEEEGAHQVDLGSARFQGYQSRAPPFPRPRLVRARGADGSGSGAEPGAPLHSHSGEGNRGNGGGGAAAPRGGGERGKSSRAPFSPRAPGARLLGSDSSSAT